MQAGGTERGRDKYMQDGESPRGERYAAYLDKTIQEPGRVIQARDYITSRAGGGIGTGNRARIVDKHASRGLPRDYMFKQTTIPFSLFKR